VYQDIGCHAGVSLAMRVEQSIAVRANGLSSASEADGKAVKVAMILYAEGARATLRVFSRRLRRVC